jgi:hypothetical protein
MAVIGALAAAITTVVAVAIRLNPPEEMDRIAFTTVRDGDCIDLRRGRGCSAHRSGLPGSA